jgi:hypothetical protein
LLKKISSRPIVNLVEGVLPPLPDFISEVNTNDELGRIFVGFFVDTDRPEEDIVFFWSEYLIFLQGIYKEFTRNLLQE